MVAWNKDDLKKVLEEDFITDPDAFRPGKRNDDVVDSMCICFALDEEWTEMFAKWCDENDLDENDPKVKCVLEHYDRVKKWLDGKEASGLYKRGETDIMIFAINY